MNKIIVYLVAVIFTLSLFSSVEAVPEAFHCVGIGPVRLDDNFCGCMWGEVLFQGEPVVGATVTMRYLNEIEVGTTSTDEYEVADGVWEEQTVYALSAEPMGAERGDYVQIDVSYGNLQISRTIRAIPALDGEQHIPLVLPESSWEISAADGYTNTVHLVDDILYMGGAAGLQQHDLTTDQRITHTVPSISTITGENRDDLWAIGEESVWQFDGTVWHEHQPFSGEYHSIAINPVTNVVWVVGNIAGSGEVATYDRDNELWQSISSFPNAPAVAITFDHTGNAWVSVWDYGVQYQITPTEWRLYRDIDGLASNRVVDIFATADSIWFATESYAGSDGDFGGIGQYNIISDTWRTYTTTAQLPAGTGLEPFATIHDLHVTADNNIYATSDAGVHQLMTADSWATYPTESPPNEISSAGDNLFITTNTVDQLMWGEPAGQPPTADITAATLTDSHLILEGTGIDFDEVGEQIVGWEWMSDDTLLCNNATCTLRRTNLSDSSPQTVTLRVQDDEGVWSEKVTMNLTNEMSPLIINLSQGASAHDNATIIIILILIASHLIIVSIVTNFKAKLDYDN